MDKEKYTGWYYERRIWTTAERNNRVRHGVWNAL